MSGQRKRLLAIVGVGVLAIGAALFVAGRVRHDDAAPVVGGPPPKPLRLGRTIELPQLRGRVRFIDGVGWAFTTDHRIVRVDPEADPPVAVHPVSKTAFDVDVDEAGAWVVDLSGAVDHLDETTLEQLGEGAVPRGSKAIVAHNDALWVLDDMGHQIVRLDADTLHVSGRMPTGGEPVHFLRDGSKLYVVSERAASTSLARVDEARDRVVEAVDLGTADPVAVRGDQVWAYEPSDSKALVESFDRRTGRKTGTAVVPSTYLTHHVVADDDGVWVIGDDDGRLVHVSAKTGSVDRSFVLPVSSLGGDLAWDGGRLWLVTGTQMAEIKT